MKLYLIGSLRNPAIPRIGNAIRQVGYDVFDDWFAAGPTADDSWQAYETERGHTYADALKGFAAEHVYEFDRSHLRSSQVVVLVLPAGKSGHLELGWALGANKYGYVLFDKVPDRYDVMYKFATDVFFDEDALYQALAELRTRMGPV